MKVIQQGSWRRGNDGKFKPFIRGCVQLNGTVVEVVSRDGNRTYVEITGTYEKIEGGFLYEFKHTHRPKYSTGASNSIYGIDVSKAVIRPYTYEVSAEELDKALGLTN
ncbi:hypothetical protein SAMN05660462_00419 [Proteiniborus ethanoligenes]|uniref:Uncharacterized protein n=1 Tax=Proteiniborus ethanoligenes TaxID=415015 RepID=A0A1H3L7Y9_9FIRM|nr:hypothetical protein [Proteiniborus ethanoligenes]SDY60309.1 hypothetical protein SAMN05660462_00419 [Proteiniborus ethanoligenes]